MPRLTKTGALKLVDPEAWQSEVEKAMEACGGHIPAAATKLGVSGRQLFRWLSLEELSHVPRAPTGVRLKTKVRKKKYPSRKKHKEQRT